MYKPSRMNRNRVDDALVLTSLRPYKVGLVSATEFIDETPVGQLVHGVLAAINEFRSAEDGADIKYKMGEKARRGGTLGRAPLGYRNTREDIDGREIRTVKLDPERAPLVTLAFELYASGEYSLEQLSDELTDRGLRTRAGRYPAGAVSTSKLAEMLRDRYYLGYINYNGEEFDGRHEALVSPKLFQRVQKVLETRGGNGVRERIHHHYLKGSLWCGKCHDEGREHRMIIQRAVGRGGGEYFYYFGRGRQEHVCDTRFIDLAVVEAVVLSHYAEIRLPEERAELVRQSMQATLADERQSGDLRRQQLTEQLARLERQEENLLDLVADGTLRPTKVRSRLASMKEKRDKIKGELGGITINLATGAAMLEAALDLLANPQELYRRSGAEQRRLLNQAIFDRLYVFDEEITEATYHTPFDELLAARDAANRPGVTAWGREVLAVAK